jgi:hypothetical protein
MWRCHAAAPIWLLAATSHELTSEMAFRSRRCEPRMWTSGWTNAGQVRSCVRSSTGCSSTGLPAPTCSLRPRAGGLEMLAAVGLLSRLSWTAERRAVADAAAPEGTTSMPPRFRWQAQESLASGTDPGREAPPEHTERPCARRRKSRRLGMYLSDVLLSHEVFAADGRLLDLGTCLPPPRSWTSASRPIGGLGTGATTCACTCKRSFRLLPHRDDGIDARCPPGSHAGGSQPCCRNDDACTHEHRWVVGLDIEEEGADGSGQN